MALVHGVFSLKGVVQNYSWGGTEFLPALLGIGNSEQRPFAEYWLGAHPGHSSLLDDGKPLSQMIRTDPLSVMGKEVASKFEDLPYLLKLLDVRQMLSIQVHPDKRSAAIGFEEENKRGIPLQAHNRNYRDRNHKPELMVALGEFWLLHGFKPEGELQQTLEQTAELNFLADIFNGGNYRALYAYVMQLQQEEVNRRLEPLVQRIVPLYEKNMLSKAEADFWAARAVQHFCKKNNYDRGIFSIYFFNLLRLGKGQGVFQPEGMPHAYLEGQNVEVMANSDNVLRAGLTDKHVDVAELMKHVRFEATRPDVLDGGKDPGHQVFITPAAEFELHRYAVEAGEKLELRATGPEIILLLRGRMHYGQNKAVQKGAALLLFAGSTFSGIAAEEVEAFRVRVPTGAKN